MDLKQYGEMVKAADRIRGSVDNDTAEAVLNTLSCSMQAIEQYCMENIPGFKTRGKVVNYVRATDDEVNQEFDILMDGNALTDEEMEPYIDGINEALGQIYDNLGWGEL